MKPVQSIYLAGPDVFLPDADALGVAKKALCERYGFEGLFPLDTELSAQALTASPQEMAFAISAGNEQLIRCCDLVVANLTPFRSPSADVGSVYELGLARGLGKPIHGYSNTHLPFLERVWALCGVIDPVTGHNTAPGPQGDIRDAQGFKIEEFGLHDNLMIEGGIRLSGGSFVCPQDESAVGSEDEASQLARLDVFETLLQGLSRV